MSAYIIPNELKVGIDVGSNIHAVAMSDSYGNIVREFEVSHTANGFQEFFTILEKESHKNNASISIAMEGYNGWARPFDSLILQKGYKLFNVNNVKLARFKEIFPGSAKTDKIDARKILELFTLQEHLPIAKKVLQEIVPSDNVNIKMKKLTRRRRQLVEEKVAILNRFNSDLQATVPDLKAITKSIDNLWFLRFFTLRGDLRELATLRKTSILKVKSIGQLYYTEISKWQKSATFNDDLDFIAPMLYDDAARMLELKGKITSLEKEIRALIPSSDIARVIDTIPGFSTVSSGELAGEIGTLDRFESEGSLALYIGMTNLDNSSGKKVGTKRNLSTNRHAKRAMITATMKHTQHVEESKQYLEKKISQGKKYQQGIRSIGRHLIRVIWNMIQNDRAYEIREI
jgi:transposase